MKRFSALLALLIGLGLGRPADATTLTGSLTAAGPTISTCSSPGDSVATLELSGTWTGTITLKTSLAQATWTSVPNIYVYGVASAAAVTANGLYQAPVSGGVCVQVVGATLTGTVGVRLTTAPGTLAVRSQNGTVASVGLALPGSTFSVSGSPVTGSGTLTGAFVNQSPNLVFAGPSSGGAAVPAWRALVAGDIPSLPFSGITGTVPANQGGTGQASYTTGDIPYASAATTISKLADVAAGSVLCAAGVGAAPAYCTSPAILSANIGNGCTVFTPTDQSGAGLTFTSNGSSYCVLGKNTVFVTLDITFPTTVDASTAKISLPVANAAIRQALSLGFNGVASSYRPNASEAGQYIVLYGNVSSTALTNVTFSGARMVISGVIQTA